jgi:23S rRNA (cytosine1962-C5)-methyltransferase
MSNEYICRNWKKEYQLLDSGKGRKLEKFGPYTLIRPDQRAVWKPAYPQDRWQQAAAEFVLAKKGGGGHWHRRQQLPESWQMSYRDLHFKVVLGSSRQVGVFPENAVHWDWIEEKIITAGGQSKVLNLFGYTGMATLAAARGGAEVVHIDSSKRAVRLGRENQEISGLGDKSIRWIVDDAVKFVEREIRRGSRYDGIVLDPPKYGMGPKKERWEFLSQFERLCVNLGELLSDKPQFVVVTAYALEQPAEILEKPLKKMMTGFEGRLALGELVSLEKSAGRKISHSITARWERK